MFPTVDKEKYTMSFARGNYFSYGRQGLFKKLIYPIPEAHGLGVHLTLNMAGEVIFGPDVEWVEDLDFSANGDRKAQFIEKISTYFPGVEANRLQPSYAGIRPKLMTNDSDVVNDFVIEHLLEDQYEVVNLLGIESPGLTSSLAIAAAVDDRLNNSVIGQ
jgi:L-2-hydroxyglutarate oxidase LhgO